MEWRGAYNSIYIDTPTSLLRKVALAKNGEVIHYVTLERLKIELSSSRIIIKIEE